MHAKSKFRNAGGTLTEPSTLKLNIPGGGPVLAVFLGVLKGLPLRLLFKKVYKKVYKKCL